MWGGKYAQAKVQTTNRSIRVLENGKPITEIFEVIITPQVNNIKRLKMEMMEQRSFKVPLDSFAIYNYKGLELDSTDVPYLLNNQLIYICFNGEKFTNVNYLNHFEFIKELKETRSGVVLLARNKIENNQILLVKRIQLKQLSNDDIFNIIKETRIIEGIKQTHLVNLINSFIYEDKLYIEMYYYNGGDLASYLAKKGCLTEKEAKVYMKQLLEAVRFYNRKGVVHRNLSPNNILFKSENKEDIVIINFKITGLIDWNLDDLCVDWGARFIPPELIENVSDEESHNSIKLDVWCLGVLLFYMVYGEYPFDGPDDNAILDNIYEQDIIFNKKIPVSNKCKVLIEQLLEKSPKDRIDLFDHAFHDWLSEDLDSVDLYSKDNLTEREKELEDKMRDLELREIEKEKQQEIDEKKIFFSGSGEASKKKLKKYNTLSFEKTDITRRSHKPSTVIMSVNPLRHHLDLQEKFNNSKNVTVTATANTTKENFNVTGNNYAKKDSFALSHRKFESTKQFNHKFDLKKSQTLSEKMSK